MHHRCIGYGGCWILALFVLANRCAADVKPGTPSAGPLSPQEELATFHIAKGFRVELVACEPNVVDPVAMAFDEDGRLFVAEMPGYPNGGVATGPIHSGTIKLLEDRDGDGSYKKCTTFAAGLRLPTSVMPWNGGLLAAVAPDILFLEDSDGDGRADHRRSLYTGFDLTNSEQLINGLQWSLDNWVYGCAGMLGGVIRSVEKPDMSRIELHGRGVRFHPELPGSLEPTSGGGQFGLAADDWQHWFTNTNSQHLRHIVLPDHYLRRNPSLPVRAVTLDIPDHGAACKVYRLSPFEPWRSRAHGSSRGGTRCAALPGHGAGCRRLHHVRLQSRGLHRRSVSGIVPWQHLHLRSRQQPHPSRSTRSAWCDLHGGACGSCPRVPGRHGYVVSTGLPHDWSGWSAYVFELLS